MVTSPTFLPTRRELFLVLSLLVILLFVSQSDYISSNSSSSLSRSLSSQSSLVLDHPKQYGLENGTYPDHRMTWKEEDALPETRLIQHAPGWNVFENIYAYNGTLFIVSSTPSKFPERKLLFSSGYGIFNGDEEYRKRAPTDKDMQILTPADAQKIFGSKTRSATVLDGTTFLSNDPKQFITHYYHFCAELLFGMWRTYSSLDPFITPDGDTTLPPPRRMIFTHVPSEEWRDYASMNQWVIRGAFPGMGMEFERDWADRAAMLTPFVFPRMVLEDRAAAAEGANYKSTWRPASNAFALKGSQSWWAPLRKSVLQFSGLSSDWIDPPPANVMELTASDASGKGKEMALGDKMVITYISRQGWGRRMLRQADHEKLVEELYKLRERYGYEVNVVNPEKLSRAEQLILAGRTTIMMGVHGNGLTSLVWMRPKPQSTVLEFFLPTGLAFDYEYTTRALGMKHYGVWDNKTFTRPNVPPVPNFPDGFHGNDIPLDGAVVARLVQKRIMLEDDDQDPSLNP